MYATGISICNTEVFMELLIATVFSLEYAVFSLTQTMYSMCMPSSDAEGG